MARKTRGPRGRPFLSKTDKEMRSKELGERISEVNVFELQLEKYRAKRKLNPKEEKKVVELEIKSRRFKTAQTAALDHTEDVPRRSVFYSPERQVEDFILFNQEIPRELRAIPQAHVSRNITFKGRRLREYRWRYVGFKDGEESVSNLNELIAHRLYPAAISTHFRVVAFPSKAARKLYVHRDSSRQPNGGIVLFGSYAADPNELILTIGNWHKARKSGEPLPLHYKLGSFIVWELVAMVDLDEQEIAPKPTPPGGTSDPSERSIRIIGEDQFATREEQEQWQRLKNQRKRTKKATRKATTKRPRRSPSRKSKPKARKPGSKAPKRRSRLLKRKPNKRK